MWERRYTVIDKIHQSRGQNDPADSLQNKLCRKVKPSSPLAAPEQHFHLSPF